MNENINLCEILKDCPEGTKFYSPLYGEVIFVGICYDTKSSFPIQVLDEGKTCKTFMSDGRYDHFNKECLLFPSKDQRDWSKWQCHKPKKPKFDPKTLKAFDRVLVRGQVGSWSPALFTYLCDVPPRKEQMMDNLVAKYVIPYNDDTKHLVGTTDEAPTYYRYWED